MKKVLLKIKHIIISWLFKEHLLEIKKDIYNKLKERDDRLCVLENHMRMVQSVTNIGIDLQPRERGRSWVAVNIRGEKQDWVQFFEGDDETIKNIQRYYRDMAKDRVIVDRPPYMKRKDFWF